MAHLVAFEVEIGQLLVTIARAMPRRMVVEKSFEIKLAEEDSNEEIGQKLRRFLSSYGVNRADAIAVISRSNAEIRELTVPPAPDEELPDMVRFKARSDFGSLNDNWALDFVPFTEDPEHPRQVLAVAVSPDLLEQTTEICDASGIKLKHIVFRPYATLDLLHSKLTDDRCRIIVDETGDQTDISLTDGSTLVATRTVRIPQGLNQQKRASQLLREIRRTITSMSRRLEGKEVAEVVICGGHADEIEELENSFTKSLDVETHILQPFEFVQTHGSFTQPDHAENYTALLGAMRQHVSGSPHPVDFLHPRKRVVKKTDLSKVYRIGGIVAAAMLLVGLLGWWMLTSQESEIERLQKQLQSQLRKNESPDDADNNVDRILANVGPVDRFSAEVPNWLDQMYEISRFLKTPDDVIVDSFDAGIRRNGPEIDMKGRVADSDTETAIRTDLLTKVDNYVEVLGDKMARSEDPVFPESFDYKILMQLPAVNQAKREINQRAIEMIKEQNERRISTAASQDQ